jgi:predicted small lipoprotein YifL
MRLFVSDGSLFQGGNRRMMRSRLHAYVALAFVAVLTACGGPVNTVPVAQAAPSASPTPTASPSPGPLSVTPTTLSFTAVGLVQNLTVGDPSYTGAFTISGCSGIVTAGTVVSGLLSVTSVAAGSCTLTIGDTFSHQVTVSVSVNTLTVPVI